MEKQTKQSEQLARVHPNAAGLDIGSREIFGSIPPDRDGPTVKCFGTFTPDLNNLADWLIKNEIDTVAMESTGVYWIPLFELLEARGLKVYLVNARHIKNVPGRKSDVQDCQWLQKLHSLGLLTCAGRKSYPRSIRHNAGCQMHMKTAVEDGNAASQAISNYP